MRRYLLIAVALVLVAVFVGFCSRGNDERGGWQPCKRSPEAVPHATGPTDIVLQIDQRGGLPPPSFMPDSIPDLTLYGDRRLIGTDAATAGQLVPGLAGRQLTEDEVQALLHNAEVACLLQRDASLDLPGVYDVPGISFEANTGSASHLTFAIGLGWSEMDANVPADQEVQRAALIDLMDGAFKLLDDDAATPLKTERLGVFFSKADGSPTQSDWPTVTWPLKESLAKFGQASPEAYPDVHCTIAEGKDVQALLAVVEGMPSGQNPYWQDGKSWYQLILRPMLPDETDCVALVA